MSVSQFDVEIVRIKYSSAVGRPSEPASAVRRRDVVSGRGACGGPRCDSVRSCGLEHPLRTARATASLAALSTGYELRAA